MNNYKERKKTILEKLPYGIISGACAMFVFFATFALVVFYVVASGIAGQTGDVVSFLENGWQVALFVFDVIFAIVAIGALIMYILGKKGVVFGIGKGKGEL